MKKKGPRTKAQDALKEATNDLRARNTLLVELVLDLRAALLAQEPLDQERLVHKIDAALKEVGI
jgi:hypothetical protein